jgi:anti-sigma regulatory factor (Ser/Thr protein kinase)
MEVMSSLTVPIAEASQTGDARRQAVAFAGRLGFDDTAAGKVAIVATELATNVLRHGGGGELLVRSLGRDGHRGVELLALDRGPGIRNLGEALRDGHSTAGTAGDGLGSVRRLASLFDIHSASGSGTAVLAQLWGTRANGGEPERLDVGAVCVAYPGEDVCGDGWAVEARTGHTLIGVVDGLGHGLHAAEASREALWRFRDNAALAPCAIVAAAHDALRSTRGAAMAVVQVDPGRRLVTYAGIGNIAGAILADGSSRHLVSHNGTLGHTVRRIDEFSYPWSKEALLVVHSDGLGSHWDLGKYPGLPRCHPSLIAGVLYRDFKRGHDDVTVVVAREHRG